MDSNSSTWGQWGTVNTLGGLWQGNSDNTQNYLSFGINRLFYQDPNSANVAIDPNGIVVSDPNDVFRRVDMAPDGRLTCQFSSGVFFTANANGAYHTGVMSANVISANSFNYNSTYRSFFSNANQTNPVANTAMAITFNNTFNSSNISIVSNSRINITKTGIYNIQLSSQIRKTSPGAGIIEIWLDKNGNTIPSTSNRIRLVDENDIVTGTINLIQSANAGDYFRLMWGSSDTSTQLTATTAGNSTMNVEIPSAIVNITPVGA